MTLSGAGRIRTLRRYAAVLVGVSLAVATLNGCSGAKTATPATAAVTTDTITTGVSAVGSLAAATTQDLGFPGGGLLSSVAVHVGNQVKAGQLLATIDDFTLRQVLVQQQANLTAQQALLGKLAASPSTSGAQSTLAQAQQILNATKSQIAATTTADDVAITRSNAQLDAAQNLANAAQAVVDAARAGCSTTPCAALASAQASLATANQGVETAKTSVATAGQKKSTDAATGQVSAASAQQGVVGAQNSAGSSSSDRPYSIEQQQSVVTTASSLVAIAQHNLDLATLTAPFDGTITAVNGNVGEYLTPSTGTTADAAGTTSGIPGTTTSTSTVARPGGTQFMVISKTGPLVAVLPAQESDAAAVVTGQEVSLALDALPYLAARGKVTAVSPSATVVSGSVTYFVTVTLETTDPRLKEGMTARATIVTAQHSAVLTVPTAAIHHDNGKTTVTTIQGDTRQAVVVTTGLVGSDRTEVVSGLSPGQSVVVAG
jgi:HlyD family secretion protein